jgi:catechol 2,3-dioxygenase-like lactoylglutathione lyase family enzyme
MKKLKSICLITPDVQSLCDFYAQVLESTPEGDGTFATISTPEISLSISSTQLTEEMAPGLKVTSQGGTCFLEFEVEDVDVEYERLKALNVDVVKHPTTQPWGVRSVWFRDPRGNLVNFYARVELNGS